MINFNPETESYSVGNTYTHIGSKSSLIQQHHYNWRMKSLESIANKPNEGLHYSGLFSLSREDAKILKQNFMQLIDNHIEILKPSREEVMFCQVIDFFEV